MPRKSLEAIEAEIRETRARLAALLARADRDYAFRPVLRALRRRAGRDLAAPIPEAGPDKEAGRLALPAALLGFALALVTLHRRRPDGRGGAPPEADQK